MDTVRPRIAPNPCGSGISVRRLPEPTFSTIIEACQHYEEKTAGLYDSKSLAVRNLYALSREVQDMVRSLKSNEDVLSTRVQDLEKVVKEWNEIFSSPSRSLQDAGVTRSSNTPSALASRITSLAGALEESESRALATRSALEQEILDLRVALRDSGRVVREQCAREMSEYRSQADGVVAFERAARAAAERSLAQCKDTMAEEIKRGIVLATLELREEAARAEREAAGSAEAARAAKEAGVAAVAAAADATRRERVQAELMKEDAGTRVERYAREAEDAQRALEVAREAHARAEAELEERWRKKWVESNAAWERSTGAVRASAMQAQSAFLTNRVRELQELCQAMQMALESAGRNTGAGLASAPPPPLQQQQPTAATNTQAKPWKGPSFAAAPSIVKHGALATGRGWKNTGLNTPVATAYAQVR